MSIVGKVDRLWRYPVNSMHGEDLGEAFVGFAGVYGADLVEGMVHRGDEIELLD